MDLADILKYFGSQRSLAARLGISRQAITMWKGKVPLLRAYQIQEITGGKLKVKDNYHANLEKEVNYENTHPNQAPN